MNTIVLFNKPFNVLTQFRPEIARQTLADFICDPRLRVAGRLDADSEGLLLLTDDGKLNARLTNPKHKAYKRYWAQLEGKITEVALAQLRQGVLLADGLTLPANVSLITPPVVWERQPPIRYRAKIPTSWVQLEIREGKNRQVRRMTAAVGFPTLRLIRVAIGRYTLDDLQPGQWRAVPVA